MDRFGASKYGRLSRVMSRMQPVNGGFPAVMKWLCRSTEATACIYAILCGGKNPAVIYNPETQKWQGADYED